MSMEALGYVFAFILPAQQKLLLICLANHADKFGDSIFPSLETLESESGMSRSTLKRAFKELLTRGLIERTAEATPVSPAFYRIVGVPEPREFERQPTCPAVLRRAVILAFQSTCEDCKRPSDSRELDADGKPWHVALVVAGKRGGIFSPDNVTLVCRACNTKRKAGRAPADSRTLAERQREEGVQIEPPPQEGGGVMLNPPGVHGEPRGESQRTLRGFTLNPEPCTDPFLDPCTDLKKQGRATPRRAPKAPERPGDNIGVITRIAHEVLDVTRGTNVDDIEIREAIKGRCATLRVAYDSTVVLSALKSARWQREHGGGPSAGAH